MWNYRTLYRFWSFGSVLSPFTRAVFLKDSFLSGTGEGMLSRDPRRSSDVSSMDGSVSPTSNSSSDIVMECSNPQVAAIEMTSIHRSRLSCVSVLKYRDSLSAVSSWKMNRLLPSGSAARTQLALKFNSNTGLRSLGFLKRAQIKVLQQIFAIF